MPAAFPERARKQLRRPDFAKSRASHSITDVVLDNPVNLPSSRMPENHAGAFVLLMEEVECVAELPMVEVVQSILLFVDVGDGGEPETQEAPSVAGGASLKLLRFVYLARALSKRPADAGGRGGGGRDEGGQKIQVHGLDDSRVPRGASSAIGRSVRTVGWQCRPKFFGCLPWRQAREELADTCSPGHQKSRKTCRIWSAWVLFCCPVKASASQAAKYVGE